MDPLDPPRFSQLAETAADAVVDALETFFKRTNQLTEIPTIEKYTLDTEDPYATELRVLQEFPDLKERLPVISVVVQGGQNRRPTIGTPYIGIVQDTPRVTGSATTGGPFDLSAATVLSFTTDVGGYEVVTLSAIYFADLAAATPAQVIRAFNRQARYATLAYDEATLQFSVHAGGRAGRASSITTEATAGFAALGISAGSDTTANPLRPPMKRYVHASQFTLTTMVIAPDSNTRRELTDLVYAWATFWAESEGFEIEGESARNFYHLSLHQEISVGNPSGDDRQPSHVDKVHRQSVQVPVTLWMYLDRPLTIGTAIWAEES